MLYSFQYDWMGGNHLIDDKVVEDDIVVEMLSGKGLKLKGKVYRIFSKTKRSYDLDHGHRYEWSAPRFYIKENTVSAGPVNVSFINLLKKHKYLEIVDL
jgi:hypothetical protein